MERLNQNKWPFLKELVKEEFFSTLDLFFSERVLPNGKEDAAICLSYLMAISRLGHLCLKVKPDEIQPDPAVLSLRADLELSKLEYLKLELKKRVRCGFQELLSSDVFTSISDDEFPEKPVCIFQDRLYLQRNWVFENKIVKNVKKLLLFSPSSFFDEKIFNETLLNNKKLLPAQKSAVEKAFSNSLTLICGGPGTGKSFTASYLLKNFLEAWDSQKPHLEVVVTAPTGKAIDHLTHKILKECKISKDVSFQTKTLHSFLGMRPGKNITFSQKPNDADIVLVDEASMIDVRLMAYLLDSIKEGARLILMGDPDQLPPIEAGNVFADLAKIEKIPSSFFKSSHRFEQKDIASLAESIRNGKREEVEKNLEKISHHELGAKNFSDPIFHIVEKHFPKPTIEKPNPEKVLREFNRFRILSCIRQGPLGVDALNQLILDKVKRNLRVGSWLSIPIIITKNDHGKKLYNGMCGVIISRFLGKSFGSFPFSENDRAFFLDYEKGEVKSFSHFYLPRFEYAYCLSVHKSQGSEFDKIFLIVPTGSEIFGKELLYTALTRARKEIEILGNKSVILRTIKSNSKKTSGVKENFF